MLYFDPSKDVDQRKLRVRKASPVQRCRSSVVLVCNAEAQNFMTVIKSPWLISLSCDVKQTQAVNILYIFVSSQFNEGLANINISSKNCVMKSCESVIFGPCVYPIRELFANICFIEVYEVLIGRENYLIEAPLPIFEYGNVKQSKPLFVDDFIDRSTSQSPFETLHIVSFHQNPALCNQIRNTF
jgi:hypothetical protein